MGIMASRLPAIRTGKLVGELAVQGGQAGGKGHHVQIGVADQGPHQVRVGKHRSEDGQSGPCWSRSGGSMTL